MSGAKYEEWGWTAGAPVLLRTADERPGRTDMVLRPDIVAVAQGGVVLSSRQGVLSSRAQAISRAVREAWLAAGNAPPVPPHVGPAPSSPRTNDPLYRRRHPEKAAPREGTDPSGPGARPGPPAAQVPKRARPAAPSAPPPAEGLGAALLRRHAELRRLDATPFAAVERNPPAPALDPTSVALGALSALAGLAIAVAAASTRPKVFDAVAEPEVARDVAVEEFDAVAEPIALLGGASEPDAPVASGEQEPEQEPDAPAASVDAAPEPEPDAPVASGEQEPDAPEPDAPAASVDAAPEPEPAHAGRPPRRRARPPSEPAADAVRCSRALRAEVDAFERALDGVRRLAAGREELLRATAPATVRP